MNKKILIIDYDVNYAHGLKIKLTVSGCKTKVVRIAENIEEIKFIAVDFKPDYIILDVDYRLVDGFYIVRELLGDDDINKSIFVYSHSKNEAEVERLKNAGITHYFNKDRIGLNEFIPRFIRTINNIEKIQ